MLRWLWRRLVAAALIQPLAWEAPYAVGVTLKRQKTKDKRQKKKEKKRRSKFPGFQRGKEKNYPEPWICKVVNI